MYKFDNIEEKVIFEKLTEKQITESENDASKKSAVINNIGDTFNAGKVQNYISEINGYISVLEKTRQNYAYRNIFSNRKLIGPVIVFLKKVIRKLLKFYVEPIAFQQTEFNSAVTPTIGRMTEIQNELLNGVVLLEKRNDELIINSNELKIKFEELTAYSEKLKDELEQIKNRYNELESTLFSKLDDCLQIQDIANAQIRNNEQILSKLCDIHAEAFNDEEFNLWDKKTVSQSGEDAICAYICTVLGIPINQCTYLDLGANHAKELSNTYLFYSHGAKGVLVEANPALIPELKFYRHADIILNKCISARSGEYADFYILNKDGLSTSDLDTANEFISKNPELSIVDKVQVETISVNDIMEKYFTKPPVILNIDIEGEEIEILKSIDFKKYRPLIIIVEVIEYKPTFTYGNKSKEIINFMERNNYIEYAFTGINSIFIDKTQIEEVK
jgi:FkbM family methyltransferase